MAKSDDATTQFVGWILLLVGSTMAYSAFKNKSMKALLMNAVSLNTTGKAVVANESLYSGPSASQQFTVETTALDTASSSDLTQYQQDTGSGGVLLSAPSGKLGPVVAFAQSQLGKPYIWAGAGPDGYDCSGLVMKAYETIGVNLPHFTVAQALLCKPTDMNTPGAIAFFGPLGAPTHDGICIGGGMMIDAPHTGAQVRTESIADFGGFSFAGIPTSAVSL